MTENQQDQDLVFQQTQNQVKNSLAAFKQNLQILQKLKKGNQSSSSDDFKQTHNGNRKNLQEIQFGMRSLQDMVESTKRVSEEERVKVDAYNLNLQSILYEQSYFMKEIHFCKEFKTPQLQQALSAEQYQKFKNLSPNITEQERQTLIQQLSQELQQRNQLRETLDEKHAQAKEKELTYSKKKKLLEDFPSYLKSIEEASIPLQQFIDIPLTEDQSNKQKAQPLPLPLYTLYQKLYQFSKDFPMFCLEVDIKGDQDQVEQMYEKYSSQIMYNPKHQLKANRSKVTNALEQQFANKQELFDHQVTEERDKSVGQKESKSKKNKDDRSSKEEEGQILGIQESSKKIKKEKKKKRSTKSHSKIKNQDDDLKSKGGLEEGEEDDMELEAGVMNLDIAFDIDEIPSQFLIDKYEKFPLYIEAVIQQNQHFFEFQKPFNDSNKHSLDVLKDKTKNELLIKLFPLQLRIYLVPQLNILTIEIRSKTQSTDSVLGNLFENDLGKQLRISELETISSQSSERLYSWLHQLAGLTLKQSSSKLQEAPEYIVGEQDLHHHYDQTIISTKLFMSKVWRRLLSNSILEIQTDNFASTKTFLKEVQNEFASVKEFQILNPNCQIKSFTELPKNNRQDEAQMVFQIELHQGKHSKYSATISVPQNYPLQPPIFKLKDMNQNSEISQQLNDELINKIDKNDLIAVEGLRPKEEAYLKSGEPMKPILQSIEDELHLYNEEYCDPTKQRDFLLSFQIRKLMNCLEILTETTKICEKKNQQSFGLSALFRKAVKGRFRKRPFSYNENLNLFEQR